MKKIKAAYYQIYKDLIFVLENDNSSLFIYDLGTNNLIKKIGENYGGGLYFINDLIVDETFKGFNINNFKQEKIFENNDIYYYTINNKYLIIRKFHQEFKVDLYLVDLTNFEFLQKLAIQGEIKYFSDQCELVCISENKLLLYRDFKLFWQQDFNELYPDDKELQIKDVYTHKDTFIVIAKCGIVCLNQKDGSLMWKTNNYALTMEVVDNFGYVCTGLSLYRVNLDNGEIYDYDREYADLPDFEYEGKRYWAAGHRVVFHDGLLWYLVYHSGDSFVIAINPETANYQWIHKIDTYEKADKIQFHNDKMFISDSGGNLFIYER